MRNSHLLLFASLLLLVGLACNAVAPSPQSTNPSTVDDVVESAVATIEARQGSRTSQPAINTSTSGIITTDLESSLMALYERANPAVVFITTEQEALALANGSGFLFDSEGHIVTNNHVVAEGDNFEVQYSDGTRSRAELVGSDVDSDLAVLRAETVPEGVQPLVLADFETVRVGQFVAAIGNPFAEQGSLSFGIVSGLGRTIASTRPADNGGTYSLPEVIQTDAPINPGNSGGPLLNLQSEVIGVNSTIRSTTGFNSGVGFAIPVAAVSRIVPSLIENGSYSYPYMGIGSSPLPMSLDMQEQLELPQPGGVYVTSVTPGSPADNAGIVPAPSAIAPGGDLIIGIDAEEVREFSDLISYLVFQTDVGQTVELTIVRNGETVTVPLTLSERP